MNQKSELMHYLRPGISGYVIGALFAALAVFIGIAVSIGATIMLLLMCLVIAGPTAAKHYELAKDLSTAQRDGSLDALYQDFQNGISLSGDDIRLGREYVFGRRMGTYHRYRDIDRIYQYVHKTNFVEDKRMLRAKLLSGSIVDLCKLDRGGNNPEVAKIAMVIVKMNPTIRVGAR